MDERMTKAEAKASVEDMKQFMDFITEHEKTHYWDEKQKEFVRRTPTNTDGE